MEKDRMSVAGSKVLDVSSATFAQEVLARSREVPVVVDFWAPWCGPCRMLGPILERLAQEANGSFRLVKLNVDENPDVAARYGVQGIPAVKAFRDGRVVAEFVGAQPEPYVRSFLRHIAPPPSDGRVAQAQARAAAGALAEAEALYRQALAAEPTNTAALTGLAEVLAVRGQVEEADRLLNQLPPEASVAPQVTRLRARLAFQIEASRLPDEMTSRKRLTADPADLDARWALATRLAAKGQYEEALQHYLDIIRGDRAYRNGGARKAMLAIFDLLGQDNPLAREYRSRLANVLY